MGWITQRLGNGFWGTVDGDNPSLPPQVTVVAAAPIYNNNLFAIPASTSEVLLLDRRFPRTNIIIYNQSQSNLLVKYNSGVTPTYFNFRVPPHGLWESEFYAFSGPMYGVWDGTNGQALVSEQY